MDFTTKVGDTKNALIATLEPAQGAVADIATVRFRMSDTLYNNKILREVDSRTSAEVTVNFTAAEVATEGHYLGEFEITYTDDKVETIPNEGYIKITIEKNVG